MRWRPGLSNQPMHSEVFASSGDASGAGVALALACDALSMEKQAKAADPLAEAGERKQILWIQDREAIRLSGRPYHHGLPSELRCRVVHVAAKTTQDALFALEEGVRCRDFAFVIGELVGNPRVLDFTASRRLSLTAEKHGVPLWLVRLDACADLSSARMRWRVRPAASFRSRWNSQAPGKSAWHAELFRARMHAPGEWILSNENGRNGQGKLGVERPNRQRSAISPDSCDLVRTTVGRSLAAL
ncbi:MAG: recA-like protein [Erythrobacter sp.]